MNTCACSSHERSGASVARLTFGAFNLVSSDLEKKKGCSVVQEVATRVQLTTSKYQVLGPLPCQNEDQKKTNKQTNKQVLLQFCLEADQKLETRI